MLVRGAADGPRRVPRKRGTIHQANRDGLEDQLGALSLVLNAIVLWTTKYMDASPSSDQKATSCGTRTSPGSPR